ncbi:MAG: hypothetical protein Q6373_024145 [Candidatus Sigynarchaeota archaeon]
MTFTSTSSANPPFRTLRGSSGIITIEKHYNGVNPNVALGFLILIIAIILPAALAAVAPAASVILLLVSLLFPGIPLFMANKMWRVEIDNANRDLKITRWHAFNKTNQKVEYIKFDDIREIVAEISPDGTKRRLVVIKLTGERLLLYESMNMTHADRFKHDFMAAVQLNNPPPTPRAVQNPPASRPPLDTLHPHVPTDPTLVLPSLRQFAIPDPNTGTSSIPGQQNPLHSLPMHASSRVDGVVSVVDGANDAKIAVDLDNRKDQQADQAMTTPAAAGVPAVKGTAATLKDDEESARQRLAEIARRKREILSRVYEPGFEPQQAPAAPGPSTPGPSTPGIQADRGVPSSVMRNRENWYNKYDSCQGFDYMLLPEIGICRPRGETIASKSPPETRSGRAPKKKHGDEDEADEIITHHVDKKVEKELGIQKVKPTCMVCTRLLKGTSFICPTCETKYCIRCARTLASRKESCWTCRKQLKVD